MNCLSRLALSTSGQRKSPCRYDSRHCNISLNYEKLEPRLLLATVSGEIFFDANRNGIRDDATSEPGMSGITARWSGSFDNPLSGNIPSGSNGGYELLNVTDDNNIVAISALAGAGKEITGPLALAGGNASIDLATQTRPTWVASGRLDSGNLADIVVTNTASDSLSLFFNQGDGSFTTTTLSVGDAPAVVLVEDLSKDGFVDLAVSYKNSTFVTLLFNDGAGGFVNRLDLPTTKAIPSIDLVDYDGDLDFDLVGISPTTAELLAWRNDSTSNTVSFAPPVATTISSGAAMVVGAQLDGNQPHELLLLDATSNSVIRYDHAGASAFQSNGSVAIDPGADGAEGNPIFVAAGDINNDGLDDLAVSRLRDRKISLYFNNAGQFGPSDQQDVFSVWYPIGLAIADADSDNDVDVVINTYNSAPGILLNEGGGQFTDAGTFGQNVSFATPLLGPPAVEDFNDDGVVDFAYSKRPQAISMVNVDFVEFDEGSYVIRTTADSNGLDFGVAPTVDLGSTVSGDYNGDFVVDGADLGVWEANFGVVSGPGKSADGDQSGAVDGGDFLLWQRNFSPAGLSASVAVAESQPVPTQATNAEHDGNLNRRGVDVLLRLSATSPSIEADSETRQLVADSILTQIGLADTATNLPQISESTSADFGTISNTATILGADTTDEIGAGLDHTDLTALDEVFAQIGEVL